jgi:hypothetical protein
MAASTISSEHLEGSEIALGKKPGGNLFWIASTPRALPRMKLLCVCCDGQTNSGAPWYRLWDPSMGHRVPQKKKHWCDGHHDDVSIIKAWWGDIGMKSKVGKCGETRWPQVCRVQTIGVAFTPLTRIFRFMKSGLQHEISAGRFLSLWGLSLVPPHSAAKTTEQFFANSLLWFEQKLKTWNSDALNG